MQKRNCFRLFGLGLNSFGGLKVIEILLNTKFSSYVLDLRIKNQFKKKKNFFFFKSISFKRFLLEKKISKKKGIVLYANGLPPIFENKSYVFCIFQNANIFRNFYNVKLLNWMFSLDFIRYLIFIFFKKNVNHWIVFSPVSKKILEKALNNQYAKITITSLYEIKLQRDEKKIEQGNNNNYQYDFIYPASSKNHKNHKFLIKTLVNLSKKKIFPRVLLTLSDFDFAKIKKNISRYNLQVFNNYIPDNKKFIKIYKKCKSLLYVSINETLALPILEAYNENLIIVAPNQEYAHQFIDPDIIYEQNNISSLESAIIKVINIKKKINKNNIKENYVSLDKFLENI